MLPHHAFCLERVKPLIAEIEFAQEEARKAHVEYRQTNEALNYLHGERLALISILSVWSQAPTTEYDVKDLLGSAVEALHDCHPGRRS